MTGCGLSPFCRGPLRTIPACRQGSVWRLGRDQRRQEPQGHRIPQDSMALFKCWSYQMPILSPPLASGPPEASCFPTQPSWQQGWGLCVSPSIPQRTLSSSDFSRSLPVRATPLPPHPLVPPSLPNFLEGARTPKDPQIPAERAPSQGPFDYPPSFPRSHKVPQRWP